MSLRLTFALRYIFSRSRLGAANWVCGLSVIAMTLVSMALLIALSVYNGYVDILLGDNGRFDPELVIVPKASRTLSLEDKDLVNFLQSKEISSYTLQLEQKAVLKSNTNEAIVSVCGIEDQHNEVLPLSHFLSEGRMPSRVARGQAIEATVGIALAVENQLSCREDAPSSYRLIFPKRKGLINPLAPASAFRSRPLSIVGVFKPLREDLDRRIIVELSAMQELLDYKETEASSIVLKLASDGRDLEDLITQLRAKAPDAYKLLNREEQHPELSFLIKAEGLMVYLIMVFILLLAAFNLVNGLSMLIIEKRSDMDTLSALGMTKKDQEGIFSSASFMLSTLGLGLGITLGTIICYLQLNYGFAKTGSGIFAQPYPIAIQFSDILLILLLNLLISLGVSFLIKYIIKKFH